MLPFWSAHLWPPRLRRHARSREKCWPQYQRTPKILLPAFSGRLEVVRGDDVGKMKIPPPLAVTLPWGSGTRWELTPLVFWKAVL